MPSPRFSDALKVIYHHGADRSPVSNTVLAERMQIQPGAVTPLLRRLAEDGLVEYVRYHGARLSPRGVAAAHRLLRRHRLVERFLVDVLHYGWEEVAMEADRLAHVASDLFVERLAEYLGNPSRDPHGAPIPDAEGGIREIEVTTLDALAVGERAVLREVTEEHPDLLRFLSSLDLTPGSRLIVVERVPFDRGVRVLVEGREAVLPGDVVVVLRVERPPG